MAGLGRSLPLLALGLALAEDEYYWPKRSRDAKLTGTSPHVGPRSFAAGPAWTWPNDGGELVRHSPLIDHKKNIYLTTANGWVRKFSPDGKLLWAWRNEAEEGKVVASPALYNGSLYVASLGAPPPGFLFALDLETGRPTMRHRLPVVFAATFGDSHNLVIHDGMAFLPARDFHVAPPHTGNNKVVALRVSDGQLLWEFTVGSTSDGPTGHFATIWNFMPAIPGDGTLLFSTPSARAYRLSVRTGEVIWKAPFPEPGGFMGCGGGSLSPDGRRFFAVGAYRRHHPDVPGAPLRTIPPCSTVPNPNHCLFGEGIVLAYDAESGEILWGRRFMPSTNGQQYPAVGSLNGPGSQTAVFIGAGHNTLFPMLEMGPQWLPQIARFAISRAQLFSAALRRLIEVPVLENHLLVLDAETGAELWTWQEEPWDHLTTAGDDPVQAREYQLTGDPREEPWCAPDAWAIPTVAGDGTVYAGSGHNGRLYAIRDANGDGRIQESEVSTFETHNGFLNGPSLAPDLLVASPCWGPMYVFKS